MYPLVPFLAQDAPTFQGRTGAAAETGGGAGGEATTQGDGSNQPLGTGSNTQQGGGGFFQSGGLLLVMLGFMGFLIISSMLAGRKQKKMRNEMLSNLGKHDRVMTTGGMIGTIVEVKDRELILRIDDESGARAHFSRDAIANVLKSTGSNADN